MFYDGNPEKGACPGPGSPGSHLNLSTIGTHSSGGPNFSLSFEVPDSTTAQSGWRDCNKCGSLFFDGGTNKGHCVVGGAHEADGASGYNFTLPHDVAPAANTQAAWRFCQFCNSLFFDGIPSKGLCPGRATLVATGIERGAPRRFHYDGHQSSGFDFVLPYQGPTPAPPPPLQVTQSGPLWTITLTHQQCEVAEGLLTTLGPLGSAAGVIQMMDAIGGDQGVDVTGVVGVSGVIVTPRGSGMYQRLVGGVYALEGIKTIADFLLKAASVQAPFATGLGLTTAAAEYVKVASGIPLGWAIVAALGGLAKLLESAPDPNEHGGVHADRPAVQGDWEKFILSQVGPGNRVALLSWLGLFSAQGGGGGDVYANRVALDSWETWTLVDNHDGTLSFQASDAQHFLTATNGGGDGSYCLVNQKSINSSERFVIRPQNDGRVALQTANGRFLSVQPGK